MKLTPTQITRIAGLGAFAVGLGLLAAFALFCWFIAPRGVGIDSIESTVARIAVGAIFIALIAVHLVYGRSLLRAAGTERAG
jgi:hypothetical protein